MNGKMNSKSNYFYVPETATISLSDDSVSFTDLYNIISNLSFDSPNATINYKIEVVPPAPQAKKLLSRAGE